MPKQIQTTVYEFDELSEAAKEKAREWFRSGYEFDSEYCIDDAMRIGKLLGLEIENVYWSGFSSQGDGASYTGSYSYAKGALAAVMEECPTDKVLHNIAIALQDMQRRAFYSLSAEISQRGHYSHEMTMQFNISDSRGIDVSEDTEESLKYTLRDFARWIYRNLESEYEYVMSDEQTDENIRANEYTFDENGKREG